MSQPRHLVLAIAGLWIAAAPAAAQVTIDGTIWQWPDQALNDVRVSASPSLFLEGPVTAVPPARGTVQGNRFSVQLPSQPVMVDIRFRRPGYFPHLLTGLSTVGGGHTVHVFLRSRQEPVSAEFCVAQSAQFELLFRQEQRLARGESRAAVQRSARINYGADILALPNPDRWDQQSPATQRMLEAMPEQQLNDLRGMLQGLFNLYDLDQMSEFSPSRWDTTFTDQDGERQRAIVTLNATQGQYRQNWILEQVDIREDEDEDLFIIEGRWRATNSTGYFFWRERQDDSDSFTGEWGYQRGQPVGEWTGTRIFDDDE